MDLHAGQIQGFFNIPVDNLYATAELCHHLETMMKKQIDGEIVVVSPDAGGVRRARYLARQFQRPATLAIIDKRRSGPGQVEQVNIVGDVKGKIAIMVDDMIDSAGTMVAGANALYNAGVKRVLAMGTHPVFSGPAVERIKNSQIELMLVTDTIPLSEEAKVLKQVKVVSIAGLFAQAIANIHVGGSVSSLFKDVEVIN
jgi:ribose-phosphate pyrophosphokinase